MSDVFGTSVQMTLYGESHGEEIGCVLTGLAAGIEVEEKEIAHALSLRRPEMGIGTPRREADPFRIVSGLYRGKTTGSALCIRIPNENCNSKDYPDNMPPRPSHADQSAVARYHGFADPRGGGHFSGRLTAAVVAGGAILLSALKKKGIWIGTHPQQIGDVRDETFSDPQRQIPLLWEKPFATLSPKAEEGMRQEILAAAREGDSLGGILETCVWGLPAGVGDPFFDSLESCLSHALFSIPAVKGVEFGDGFALAARRASEVNDPYGVVEGEIRPLTNHNGGLLGGITTGNALILRTAMKPTPTIALPQRTVMPQTGEEIVHRFGGRHDPCIVPRARVVQDAVVALVLADRLTLAFGTDYLRG